MPDHDPESLLDAQLRDVPLPEGLLERLRAASGANRLWSDDELDTELVQVGAPHNLVVRCRQVVHDEPLDAALCDVAVPDGLVPALQRIPASRPVVLRRAPSWLQRQLTNMALAASLAMLIGGGYLAALFGLLSPLRSPRAESITLLVEDLGPLDLRSERAPIAALDVAVLPATAAPAELEETAEQFVAVYGQQEPSPAIARGAAGELLAQLGSGFDPLRDMLLLRYGALGYESKDEAQREFVAVKQGTPRGLEPPVVRGFDRKFLLRQGVHPVVSPSSHELLRGTRVPLSTDTASFELTQRKLAEGRWPAAADVRVEDFLAAVNYRFPAPAPGRLGLSLAGGPSLFGQPLANIPGASLLQIGVQAGRAPFRRLPATHFIVALDGSAAMQSAGRFDAARRALAGLAEQLGPRDRLSLVVFRDEGVQTIEALDQASAGVLSFALEQFEPRGNMNLGAGVQAALSLALRNELDERLVQQVAIITPGGAIVPEPQFERLRELAAEACARDVLLTLLETGGLSAGDPTLASLATAAQGTVRAAASADELRFALIETLTGSSTQIAADAALRVTFNPRTVAAYRLLGHEANAMSGAVPARIDADLRAGQTATALFEVWLLPGSEDELALVEVEWRDPSSGEKQSQRRSFGRLQLAGVFGESARSLQQAALAAETAEVLRDSYFVQGKPRSLQHVIDGAKNASYDVSRQADFQKFVTFLRDLDKVKNKRGE